jgi:hypothetical protein
MLNNGMGVGLGSYPGKFGQLSANYANQLSANQLSANLLGANQLNANLLGANMYGANQFGANQYGANQYGANQYGANQYGGFGNNGMAQLHQLRMGLGSYPGKASHNLAMQTQQIQNQAIPAAGGYPLKFGKKLGLGSAYGK